MDDSKNVTVMVTGKEKALVGKIAEKVFQALLSGRPGRPDRAGGIVPSGYSGLLEAKQRFDPELGVPFLAYASRESEGPCWIRSDCNPLCAHPRSCQKGQATEKGEENFCARDETPETGGWRKNWAGAWMKFKKFPPKRSTCSGQRKCRKGRRDAVSRHDRGRAGTGGRRSSVKRELAETMQACLENLPADELRMVLLGRVLENVQAQRVRRNDGLLDANRLQPGRAGP